MSELGEAVVLRARSGSDAAWEVDGLTADALGGTSSATGYSSGDTLEAIAWGGADQTPLAALTASWIDAPTCRLQLALSAAQAAALGVGVYPLEVTGIASGVRRPILDAWLEVTEAPGAASGPPVYGTVSDMLDVARAWLPAVRFETGMANFTRQRAMARAWLDDLIQKSYRPWARWGGRRNPYLDSGPLGVGEAFDPIFRGYLVSNFLMVTDKTRIVCAYKAVALVCESMLSFDEADPFPMRAKYYHGKASQQVLGYRAEVDINGDGRADFAFNLGVHSIR